jgi:predicted alpha/beta hydrolase
VVEGQRLMQSTSDIFLGWDQAPGEDGEVHHFYLRQLWDWKLSADIETMTPEGLGIYAQMCGWTLARAHARSGDPIAIGAYLGAGDRFDRALCDFAVAYADQNEKDFAALERAIAANEVHAVTGL